MLGKLFSRKRGGPPAIVEAGPLRVKRCRPGWVMYLLTDHLIGGAFDLYGEFSHGETILFEKLIQPGWIAVDAGANMGTHTLTFSRLVGPNGNVLSFEPQRPIYQVLCGNLALNNCLNVIAQQACVGEAPGTMIVPMLDYTAINNYGGLALGQWAEGYQVPVVTIDGLNLPRCDFIKIDVEGMELEVLKGAAAAIAANRPILYVENNRIDKSPALVGWLLDAGYALYWHKPLVFNPDNYFGVKENFYGRTIAHNMLCVPPERSVDTTGLKPIKSIAELPSEDP